jgi:glycerophosphoryl diester phosphodiesterase
LPPFTNRTQERSDVHILNTIFNGSIFLDPEKKLFTGMQGSQRCHTRPFHVKCVAMISFMPRAALVLLLSLLLPQSNLSAVEIIAHRGASADAPENTLVSMKRAWEQKADAIELDLWLSKDGKLIVFHDADTKRFEGQPRKISGLTWKETQQLDVGAWKGEQFKNERIPTLESILATVPARRRAVLEIKCGPEIVPELSRVIGGSGRTPEQLAIISFNFDALKESKKRLPKIEHYFLLDYKKDPQTGSFPELAPSIARAKGADFDGLNLQFKWPITKDFVAEVKAAGLKLFVWTVDDAEIARRLADAGVDGITTNRPQWLREQLK